MYLIDYRNISFFHPNLIKIMDAVEAEFGVFYITSLWRADGVHNTIPLRAVDLRCRNLIIGRTIEQWLNERWVYDPTRPALDVCLYHDTGAGVHLHLQVHDDTVKA